MFEQSWVSHWYCAAEDCNSHSCYRSSAHCRTNLCWLCPLLYVGFDSQKNPIIKWCSLKSLFLMHGPAQTCRCSSVHVHSIVREKRKKALWEKSVCLSKLEKLELSLEFCYQNSSISIKWRCRLQKTILNVCSSCSYFWEKMLGVLVKN
jgi:hypothetical protein